MMHPAGLEAREPGAGWGAAADAQMGDLARAGLGAVVRGRARTLCARPLTVEDHAKRIVHCPTGAR